MVVSMTIEEEINIVEQCRNNQQAFGQLFDYYYAPIFGYIYRRTADYDLSKDITAETFLKAYLTIYRFRHRGYSISTWFYRIATNELGQFYRKQKYKPLSLQQLLENPQTEMLLHQQNDDERDLLEKELNDYETYNQIRVSLLKLDLKYQEVISLKYFEQKNSKEIALILNKNAGTVKSLISRGLEKLRNLL